MLLKILVPVQYNVSFLHGYSQIFMTCNSFAKSMQNTLKIIVKFLNLALDVLANVLDEEETDQDLILPSQISSQPTPTKE